MTWTWGDGERRTSLRAGWGDSEGGGETCIGGGETTASGNLTGTGLAMGGAGAGGNMDE